MGGFLILLGLAGLLFGLVNLVRPLERLGIATRGRALLLAGASLLVVTAGGAILPPQEPVDPHLAPQESTIAEVGAVETTTTWPVTTTSAAVTDTTVSSDKDTTTGLAVGDPVEGELVVWFFDVGQGDSTLLQGPDFTILVDAGRHDRSDVVPHLRSADVIEIDLLVGTHPHADHIGQFPQVLEAFPVTEVWMSGDTTTTLTFERVLDTILASDAGYHEARAGETYQLGSAWIEVINPSETTGDLHAGSISLRVIYGQVVFLFTGDAEAHTEQAMVRRGHDLRAQVLQVGHHGSRTSSTTGFLQAVAPQVAVYSAGAGNQYGHPHPEAIDRLLASGAEVYGTDVHGTIRVVTDGTNIHVDLNPGVPAAITGPIAATTTTAAAAGNGCGPDQVDINTAGVEDLQKIIQIGPERAQQIVELRPFSSVDAMDRISGIGPARLADIKAQGIACVP